MKKYPNDFGDPNYHGPPSKERIQEIKKRYYWDENGLLGFRGRLYLDGIPYLEPKDDTR